MKKVVLMVLMLLSIEGWSIDTVRVDLKPMWLGHNENGFVSRSNSSRVVHLPVQKCEGFALEIHSPNSFSLFFNNRLTHSQIKTFRITTADLKRLVGESGMISIFSQQGFDPVTCQAVNQVEENSFGKKAKTTSGFVIVMGILLSVAFILLLRSLPALTLDYFNMGKIFTLKTFDDTQTLRLTSVSNLFFYLFCSALIAVVLFVFHHRADLLEVRFGQSLGETSLLTVILFALLMAKALWVNMLTGLFGLSDFKSGQFRDYLKIGLIGFSFCAIVLTILVMIGATWWRWIGALEYFLVILYLAFVAVTFLKLLSQGGFTAFHLFSYLCVAEIIPLIILFNTYFF